MADADVQWFWCLEHRRAEPEGEACAQDKRLGPYDSREEAANWRQRHEAREEHWEEQDEEWENWGAEAPDDDSTG